MMKNTIAELKTGNGDLYAIVEYDDERDAAWKIIVSEPETLIRANMVELDPAEFVDLFSLMGEVARFFGFEPAQFFSDDDSEDEKETDEVAA